MFSLGCVYSCGHGVQKDEKVAFEWFRKAAEKGYSHAMEMVGLLYQIGDGVEKDEDKAREWFRKVGVEENYFPDPEKERQKELLNRLLDTEDREEHIQLSMMLFPEMDRKEAEKLADELGCF